MVKRKTRVLNNDHCFTGTGRQVWREQARGIALGNQGLRNSLEGYKVDYKLDIDGAVFQTGGIFDPEEIKLRSSRTYYRFISTKEHSLHGASRGVFGSWWLMDEHYSYLAILASERANSLSEYAAQALYIPPGWGDCGYVISARLNTPLRAWAGRGKIASEGLSASIARSDKSTPVVYGIPGVSENILQLYIPQPYCLDGSGKNSISFFSMISCGRA